MNVLQQKSNGCQKYMKVYTPIIWLSIISLLIAGVYLVLGIVSTYFKIQQTWFTTCTQNQQRQFFSQISLIQPLNIAVISLACLLEIFTIGCTGYQLSKGYKTNLCQKTLLEILLCFHLFGFLYYGIALGYSLKSVIFGLNIQQCTSETNLLNTYVKNNIVLIILAGLCQVTILIRFNFIAHLLRQIKAPDYQQQRIQEKQHELFHENSLKDKRQRPSEIVLLLNPANSIDNLKQNDTQKQDLPQEEIVKTKSIKKSKIFNRQRLSHESHAFSSQYTPANQSQLKTDVNKLEQHHQINQFKVTDEHKNVILSSQDKETNNNDRRREKQQSTHQRGNQQSKCKIFQPLKLTDSHLRPSSNIFK